MRWRRAVLLLPATAAVLGLTVVSGRPTRTQEPYDIAGVGHEKGKAGAKIVVIEFVDFGCSACASFARQTLPQIERNWIATGRARIRLIPFDALGTGRSAARAAECAAQQDAFWPMHDLLFARQREWQARRAQREKFERWAAELGMDAKQFRACWANDPRGEWLNRNNKLARNAGVPGTPAFIVNGRPLVGALPYADFEAAFEAAARPAPEPRGAE